MLLTFFYFLATSLNMKFRRFLIAAFLLGSMSVFSQQIDPLTKAMLNGYDELLKENPKDYQTYYERAAQYYQLSLYDRAFNDIAKALEFTPAKEAALVAQEYSLLSDIAVAAKDYQKALTAVERALTISPDSYADLYRKGNVLLYLNQPQEAYNTFKSMQRLKSRSPEAFSGMAKACVMMGNEQEAESLIKHIEESDPTNYITYCRIGDIYHDMKQDERAATNYLMAFSLARNPQRPLGSLIDLSRSNYPAFKSAIDYAVSRTDNKAPLYYIFSNVAFNSGNYKDAEAALSSLMKLKEGREPSVMAMLAQTDLALNRPEDALSNIDQALALGETPDLLIIKSQALRALGRPAQGVLEARKALDMKPSNVDAMLELGAAAIDAGDSATALEALNDAIMSDSGNPLPLLLRGYVNENMLKDNRKGAADYLRASNLSADEFPNVAWKALAKARAGKKLDADAMMENALSGVSDKDHLYMAAVYYAQTGDLEKGADLLNKALAAGYNNQYNLRTANTANLSIAPIRHLLK